MVLASDIEERLKQYVPRVSSYVSFIDLPYFFSDDVSPEPFADDAIRFGSYGVGSLRKGLIIFLGWPKRCNSAKTTSRPTFTLIGHIDKRLKDVPLTVPVNIPSPDVPLDEEAYERYGRCMDYGLFFHGRTLTN